VDTYSFLLGLAGLLLIWLTVGITIRRWGPGKTTRWVRCPETEIRARVGVRYAEKGFGTVQASDVTACSHLAGAKLNCDKACLNLL
jgi:hypothetical protein